jgi:hypothetical protein
VEQSVFSDLFSSSGDNVRKTNPFDQGEDKPEVNRTSVAFVRAAGQAGCVGIDRVG